MAKDKHYYLVNKILSSTEVFGYIAGGPMGFVPVYLDMKDAKKEVGEIYNVQKVPVTDPPDRKLKTQKT